MAGFTINNNEDQKQPDYPKITDHYAIPLCLKRRLNTNSKVNLLNDYKLINPNIRVLFNKYNHLFFDNKLNDVALRWDYREKINAGLCQQFTVNDTEIIDINLSVNLLQYRPTKDLIETLLHEMIHSYLFVKKIHHKDNTHHGRRFLSIMNVINYVCNESELNVWVRHDFLSEVNMNKSHKWQCNGACKGNIKRPMCRPPGKHERWWKKHQIECGGQFEIVEINTTKNKMTNEEWKQKKLIDKQQKRKKREMHKEQRDKEKKRKKRIKYKNYKQERRKGKKYNYMD